MVKVIVTRVRPSGQLENPEVFDVDEVQMGATCLVMVWRKYRSLEYDKTVDRTLHIPLIHVWDWQEVG